MLSVFRRLTNASYSLMSACDMTSRDKRRKRSYDLKKKKSRQKYFSRYHQLSRQKSRMKSIVLHYQCDEKQVYSISTNNQTLEEHHRENEEEIKNPTGSQIQPFFSPNFIFLDGDDSRAVSSDKGTDGG